MVDWVRESALGEVFFGFPRVRCIVDLGTALNPPMIVAGHDAGRNVANGSRETHLIMYSIPQHARFIHVTPATSEMALSMFVRKRIYEPLGLRLAPDNYPPDGLVGASSTKSIVFEDLLFDYDCASPSHALEVLGHRARRE